MVELQWNNAIVAKLVDTNLAVAAWNVKERDMYLLGLGLVFLAMKYLEIGPVAAWDWWVVLTPFGLAVLWWAWADSTGYTKRKAMERESQRQEDRRERTRVALGGLPKKKKR